MSVVVFIPLGVPCFEKAQGGNILLFQVQSSKIYINFHNLQMFFPQKVRSQKISNLQLSNPFVAKLSSKPTFLPWKSPLHSATALLSVKGTSKMWCRPSQCPSCRHALLDQETSHLSNILGKSNLISQQNPPQPIDMRWKLRTVRFDPKLEVKNQGFVHFYSHVVLGCINSA